jgi:hypothetical protein
VGGEFKDTASRHCAHGRAASIGTLSASRVASSNGVPTNCTDSGRPSPLTIGRSGYQCPYFVVVSGSGVGGARSSEPCLDRNG